MHTPISEAKFQPYEESEDTIKCVGMTARNTSRASPNLSHTDIVSLFLGKYRLVHRPTFTKESIRGTSIRGPITVASAAPEPMPKRVVATAIATSK